MSSEKEPCAFCGDIHWTEAHYAFGRLICRKCRSGQAAAVSRPPTAAQQVQIADWLKPRPTWQTLNQRELARPGEVLRG